MKTTIGQIIKAIKSGYEVTVTINGESYILEEPKADDKLVSRKEFLSTYNEELEKHFKEQDDDVESSKAHIYGYPITVHWNGIYCDCDDGATAYNHIISAIEAVDEELD